MTQVRVGAVSFKGNPINLVGPRLSVGQAVPDFTCLKGLDKVTLADTPAKARIFSVVPSLDTGVCSLQTKRFAEELKALGDKVASYTVSLDLPFAMGRFCTAEGITNTTTLSDTHNHSFGKAFGVLIEGLPLPLLTRAVFVVGPDGKIAHSEYVSEVTNHPDYEAALKALRQAAGT